MKMKTWNIGLSAWIIQDGNYSDFEVGQYAEFALEFHSLNQFEIIDKGRISAKHLTDVNYQIEGKVVYLDKKLWVIDFGLLAFSTYAPQGIKVGSFVSGEISLLIDDYPYFEYLYKEENIPPMIYSWNIQSIRMQTAPFVEEISTKPGPTFGKKVRVRDSTKLGYESILATDAMKDDYGFGEYILECDKLDIPPKYTSVTAL